MKKKATNKQSKQFDILKKIRKPMPRPTTVITPKKYDRKDKSWKKGINNT